MRLGHLWRPPNFIFANKFAREDSFPNCRWQFSLMTPFWRVMSSTIIETYHEKNRPRGSVLFMEGRMY